MKNSRKIICVNFANKFGLNICKSSQTTKNKLVKNTLMKVVEQLYGFNMSKKDYAKLIKAEKISLRY